MVSSIRNVVVIGVALILSACTYQTNYVDPARGTANAVKSQYVFKAMAKTGSDIFVRSELNVDHEALAMGISCSAHKYKNLLNDEFEVFLKHIDVDDQFERVDDVENVPFTESTIFIDIHTIRTDYRCVLIASYNMRCISRTRMRGEIIRVIDGEKMSFPFKIEEELNDSAWTCGHVSKAVQASSLASLQKLYEHIIS
ncbi:hypothetical protein [Kordiimonas sp. SCSIO 12610]|uniref:hypothetical protein n=1 Tax=Kordiimonas sp. SCSIO 12610 TaxID=2829597 RepID=UPI00210BE6B4|nr:hypothetical protein [Kordiimonas sp. SCSIO 12610]UTW55962.1 hypothetical protein KFF44_03455 [Kordiimonas sp. SCSIO 12610]